MLGTSLEVHLLIVKSSEELNVTQLIPIQLTKALNMPEYTWFLVYGC
jgi:hypothetical protein